MIIFLYGEDSYRSLQKLNEIIESYKKVHKTGLNLVLLNAKEIIFNDLENNLKMATMFAEKKLVVLKEVFANKKFQEDLLEVIKKLNSSEDIIVIFENEKVDERLKLFKTLKKEAKAQEFELLTGVPLKNWIKKELESNNVKIEPLAQNLLENFVGSDLWRMHNEIIKLSNYKTGKIITEADIKLLVRPTIENDIFKTIEALAQKNKKLALDLIYKHLENDDNCLYLLSMIAYQFRTLLIIKDLIEKRVPQAMIAKKAGLHPFVVQKSFYLCNKFTLTELRKIYQRIYQMDLEIKVGKILPETALDLLISEI